VPSALVIIPTFNERANLPDLIAALTPLSSSLDVLIVDDNSPDGTGTAADQLAEQLGWLHVLHRKTREGLGRAYCAGFGWALEREYTFVCEMDGDLSHNPADLPRLIAAAADADLVIGSRYIGGIRVINWPLRRLLLSTGAAKYVRIITGLPLADPTGGFKCFRREALAELDLASIRTNGYGFQIEVNHRLWREGRRLVEIPIVFTERRQGRSKMSGRIVVEAITLVWRLVWENGGHRRPRRNHSPGPSPSVQVIAREEH